MAGTIMYAAVVGSVYLHRYLMDYLKEFGCTFRKNEEWQRLIKEIEEFKKDWKRNGDNSNPG